MTGDKPVDDGLAALDALGFKLTPWQRDVYERWTARPGGWSVEEMAVAARRQSKLAFQRDWIRLQVAAGVHVHVLTADPRGIECPGGQCSAAELRDVRRLGASRYLVGGDVVARQALARFRADRSPGFERVVVDEWTSARPEPVRGLVGRLEAAAGRRGWTRVAGLLARIDERNLGK